MSSEGLLPVSLLWGAEQASQGAWRRLAVLGDRAVGTAGGLGRGQSCPASSGQGEGAKRAAAGLQGELMCCPRRGWWLGAGKHDGASA